MHIALYKPDIPQNTAAIIRLGACLSLKIHIIEPCGFNLHDSRFKRVVMDYIGLSKIFRYQDYDDFINKNKKYSIFFKYKNKEKDLFNLRGLINYQFKELGIKNIYNINKDTFSNKRVFFSHRRESQNFRDTGRMLNIIAFND